MNTPQKLRDVETVICRASNISREEIYGRIRTPEVCDARHTIWFIANVYLKYTYPKLGKVYHRDHTTIMHGVRRIGKSEISDKIIEKINKNYPRLLDRTVGPDEPKTLENWDL